MHNAQMILPSRRFCARVARIVEGLCASTLRTQSVHVKVLSIINADDGWMGVDISASVVDAALYYVLPVVDFVHGPPKWIRIFWASEERWVTARVDRVIRAHGTSLCVYLYFPEEEREGSVTGADAFFSYEI